MSLGLYRMCFVRLQCCSVFWILHVKCAEPDEVNGVNETAVAAQQNRFTFDSLKVNFVV